jgi:hypothetical protein
MARGLPYLTEDGLARRLGIAKSELTSMQQGAVPPDILERLQDLLRDELLHEATQSLAASITGMPEDEAWRLVTSLGREWADITGATGLTLDRRSRRIWLVIDGDRVVRAFAG